MCSSCVEIDQSFATLPLYPLVVLSQDCGRIWPTTSLVKQLTTVTVPYIVHESRIYTHVRIRIRVVFWPRSLCCWVRRDSIIILDLLDFVNTRTSPKVSTHTELPLNLSQRASAINHWTMRRYKIMMLYPAPFRPRFDQVTQWCINPWDSSSDNWQSNNIRSMGSVSVAWYKGKAGLFETDLWR